jgi:hypothetical protein
MHKPSEIHMKVTLRVLRYFKSFSGRGILFKKSNHLNLIGYTDANWAENLTDKKFTSGYFTFVSGNLIT